MRFNNRTAVVTGAAAGIGKSAARLLAEHGVKVIMLDRDEKRLAEAADEIRGKVSGSEISAMTADVGDRASLDGVISGLNAENPDILVNNAGVTRDNLLMRMSDEEFQKVIDTNLKGTFHCMRAAIRPMMKKRRGRIISISSVVGLMGNAGQINYAASKAGVIGMTKSLAREVASRHITVNAVAPGFIKTDMTAVLSDSVKEGILHGIPLGELGEAEDVANAVLYLASDEAAYITGQVISVDGGMAM